MDPKLKNYIVNDAKEFLASESWYAERGLPFRRGVSSTDLFNAVDEKGTYRERKPRLMFPLLENRL